MFSALHSSNCEQTTFQLSSLIRLPETLQWSVANSSNINDYDELIAQVWPNYFLTPSDIEIPELFDTAERENYQNNHLMIGIRDSSTNQLQACVSLIALHCESFTQLSDDGWRWAYRQAHLSLSANTIALQQVTVLPGFRGHNFSEYLIQLAKKLAHSFNINHMIVPVRPVIKHQYPTMPMESFIERIVSGELSDPWLNRHSLEGASMLNICARSIVINASIRWWEQQLNLSLNRTGEEVIPFAITPLKVNIDNQVALYEEPNIWYYYSLE